MRNNEFYCKATKTAFGNVTIRSTQTEFHVIFSVLRKCVRMGKDVIDKEDT